MKCMLLQIHWVKIVLLVFYFDNSHVVLRKLGSL